MAQMVAMIMLPVEELTRPTTAGVKYAPTVSVNKNQKARHLKWFLNA